MMDLWLNFWSSFSNLFDTWLGFFGAIAGLTVAAVRGFAPMRSALVGLLCGVALVFLVNGLSPNATPCLQRSKGWDILRAYSLNCEDPSQSPAAVRR